MKQHRILIALFIALMGFGTQSQAALVILDRIIAVVDEDVVMESQLNQRLSSVKAQLTENQRGQIPSDEELKTQLIERLIVESVQIQMAERAGVRISDEELNESMTASRLKTNSPFSNLDNLLSVLVSLTQKCEIRFGVR